MGKTYEKYSREDGVFYDMFTDSIVTIREKDESIDIIEYGSDTNGNVMFSYDSREEFESDSEYYIEVSPNIVSDPLEGAVDLISEVIEKEDTVSLEEQDLIFLLEYFQRKACTESSEADC